MDLQIRLVGDRSQDHLRYKWTVEMQPPICLLPFAIEWCGQVRFITAIKFGHTGNACVDNDDNADAGPAPEPPSAAIEAFCLQVPGAATSQVV